MTKHRPDTSEESARFAQRCVCGGQIVWFEAPLLDTDGASWKVGYGCETLRRPTRAFEVCGGES